MTIYEKGESIGGALIGYATHDIANKEDLQSQISYYKRMVEKLKITVNLNTEVNPKMMRSILHQYDVTVIAAGAGVDLEALPIPEQEGMLVTAADVANGKVKVGQKVVVLGGGKIGLTLAEALKQEGKDVTVVEKEKRIAGDVIPALSMDSCE